MKKNETLSLEHRKYLKKIHTDKYLVWICRFLILAVIIGMWELLAQLKIIDTFIMSSPSRIAKTIKQLIENGTLLHHVGITLYETVIGFIIATALGTLIAVMLWWSEKLRKILEPYIVVLNSLPKIALGPIIIVWFGTGQGSIIFMTVLITVIVTIITMMNGFLATDKNKMLLLKSMGANKLQTFTKLVVPASLPTFISMLKINVGMAWIGSIMGEYLTSQAGLGYLIVYGGQVFKLDLVMASTVILCLLAAVMYFMVALLERLVIKWE